MSGKQTIFQERLEWLGANHENKGGSSDKFYEITIEWNGGRTYVETRRWGRFGAKGQTKIIEHRSEWRALDSARRQLASKRAKGYTPPIAPLKRLGSVL